MRVAFGRLAVTGGVSVAIHLFNAYPFRQIPGDV
jgi:hypothetical protein